MSNPSWSRTCYVEQTSLELTEICLYFPKARVKDLYQHIGIRLHTLWESLNHEIQGHLEILSCLTWHPPSPTPTPLLSPAWSWCSLHTSGDQGARFSLAHFSFGRIKSCLPPLFVHPQPPGWMRSAPLYTSLFWLSSSRAASANQFSQVPSNRHLWFIRLWPFKWQWAWQERLQKEVNEQAHHSGTQGVRLKTGCPAMPDPKLPA